MYHSKRAVISIPIYSLVILLFIAVFVLCYSYYTVSKATITYENQKNEIITGLSSLRGELLRTVSLKGDSASIVADPYQSYPITAKNVTLYSSVYSKAKKADINITMLGIPFCSAYNFSSRAIIVASYTGSCIQITVP